MSNTFSNNFSKRYATSKTGISFFEALALLFIALKLTGHIAWSWWWVLLPIWGPLVLLVVIFLIVVIYVETKRR